jgi:hypothetical protein
MPVSRVPVRTGVAMLVGLLLMLVMTTGKRSRRHDHAVEVLGAIDIASRGLRQHELLGVVLHRLPAGGAEIGPWLAGLRPLGTIRAGRPV